MRVLMAPDSFGDTLTAPQAAEAMARGWLSSAPTDEVLQQPLSDGGPGFVQLLHDALGGQLHPIVVEGPMGERTPSSLLVTGDANRRTVWIESAQAIGLHLVAPEQRDPGLATTVGVGQQLLAARELGADRIIIGLGGSATNDAGSGALSALGIGAAGRLSAGAAALAQVTSADVVELAPVRQQWSGIELIGAVDVGTPLLGLQGASATFAEQKGASPQQAQQLESALGHFVGAIETSYPSPTDLVSGKPLRRDRGFGAGSAGGLGYALSLLGARLLSGTQIVNEAVGLAAQIGQVDVVVTGEGCLDWQTVAGKVVAGVCEAAAAQARPTIVIPGQSRMGRREAMALGASGVYPISHDAASLKRSLARPAEALAERAAAVAATWSR